MHEPFFVESLEIAWIYGDVPKQQALHQVWNIVTIPDGPVFQPSHGPPHLGTLNGPLTPGESARTQRKGSNKKEGGTHQHVHI